MEKDEIRGILDSIRMLLGDEGAEMTEEVVNEFFRDQTDLYLSEEDFIRKVEASPRLGQFFKDLFKLYGN